MSEYRWTFGAAGSGLHVTVTIDTTAETFTVASLEGSFDLNALWFSDGDALVEGNTTLPRGQNDLRMHGAGGLAWDFFGFVSGTGLGKEGRAKHSFFDQGETQTYSLSQLGLDAHDAEALSAMSLGLRASAVNVKGRGGGHERLVSLKAELLGGDDGPCNRAPDAYDDARIAAAGSSVTGTLLAQDPDTGDDVDFALLGAAPAGFSLDGETGAWRFDASGYDSLGGTDSAEVKIAFRASDAAGLSDDAVLTIFVTGNNDAPDAAAGTGAVLAGGTTTGTLEATDADAGDALSFSVVGTAPAGFTLNPDGSWSFEAVGYETLPAGTPLDLVVTYQVADAAGAKDTATLTLTVTGVNDAPTGTDDTATVGENEAASFDVLANDLDADGTAGRSLAVLGTAAVTSTNPAVNGIDAAAAFSIVDGRITFAPGTLFDALAVGQVATVTLPYDVADGAGGTGSATLTLTVEGANDAPRAVADSGTAGENETKRFNVIANDTDVDTGDSRFLASIGTVAVSSANAALDGSNAASAFSIEAGELKFTPGTLFDGLGAGETATVTVDYVARDLANATATGSFTLTVSGASDRPVLRQDIVIATNNTTVVLPWSVFLANDSDPDSTLEISGLRLSTFVGFFENVSGLVNDTEKQTIGFTLGNISSTRQLIYTATDGSTSVDGTISISPWANTTSSISLTGSYAASYLDVGAGNDSLAGSTSGTVINGGTLRDWMIGGTGNDTMSGGLGADTFVIAIDHGQDRIGDFNGAQGDRLDLDTAQFRRAVAVGTDTRVEYGSDADFTTLRGSVLLVGVALQDFQDNQAAWVI
jgi:VCBS repeat-containing protein